MAGRRQGGLPGSARVVCVLGGGRGGDFGRSRKAAGRGLRRSGACRERAGTGIVGCVGPAASCRQTPWQGVGPGR